MDQYGNGNQVGDRPTDEYCTHSEPVSLKETLVDNDNIPSHHTPKVTMSGPEDKTVVQSGTPGAAANLDPDNSVKPLPGWRFALLGLGLCLGLFLAMLDTSIVATSLYSIAVEFNELDTINWVALAYTLTFLSFAVLFARISDVIGRKAAFLSAFVIFVAFSIGCGFAQSLNQLIVCRALQGLGGSGLYSIAIIIFPELTPDDKKKFIAGIIGIVIAVAGVLGPVLGGLLTHYRSWRWVFWINGPIGAFSAIAFWLCWPDKKYLLDLERRQWKHLDYLGSLLLITASVLICFAFQNGAINASQWKEAVFIAPVVVGAFSIFGLFAWEHFIERRWNGKLAAAMPLNLLRNHVYSAGVLNTMFLGFAYLLSIYTFPIRFQVVYRKSALDSGLMLLPMLAAAAIGSAAAGVISKNKNRLFETLIAACLFMILGCALETTAEPSEAYEPKVLGFLVFIGLGFGLSAAASTMLGATEAPIWEHAPAQGIIAQLRILGGSLGIATSSAILGIKTRDQLTGILSPAQLTGLAAQISSLTPQQHAAVRVAYTDALKEDMIVCCVILAAGFVFTLGVYQKNRVSLEERQRLRVIEEQDRRRLSKEKVPASQPPAPENQAPVPGHQNPATSGGGVFTSQV